MKIILSVASMLAMVAVAILLSLTPNEVEANNNQFEIIAVDNLRNTGLTVYVLRDRMTGCEYVLTNKGGIVQRGAPNVDQLCAI